MSQESFHYFSPSHDLLPRDYSAKWNSKHYRSLWQYFDINENGDADAPVQSRVHYFIDILRQYVKREYALLYSANNKSHAGCCVYGAGGENFA
jgi:hypothetical protein